MADDTPTEPKQVQDIKHIESGFCARNFYSAATGNGSWQAAGAPTGDLCLGGIAGAGGTIGIDLKQGKMAKPDITSGPPELKLQRYITSNTILSAGLQDGGGNAYLSALTHGGLANEVLNNGHVSAEGTGIGVAVGLDKQTTLTAQAGHSRGGGVMASVAGARTYDNNLTVAAEARVDGREIKVRAGATYDKEFDNGKIKLGVGGGLETCFNAAACQTATPYAQVIGEVQVSAKNTVQAMVGYRDGVVTTTGVYHDFDVGGIPISAGPEVELTPKSTKMGVGFKTSF